MPENRVPPPQETQRTQWNASLHKNIIRPALVKDVPGIKALIDPHVETGVMLPKSLTVLYESLRDFQVCVEGEWVIGAGALHMLWEDLAEIRSMGVHPDYHGQGIGKALGKALLADAEQLGVGRVFALTYETGFFLSLGFRVIDKNLLPRKVWSDCINCHKFPMCDEVAMIKDFRTFPEGPVGPPPELPQVIDLEKLVPGLRLLKP